MWVVSCFMYGQHAMPYHISSAKVLFCGFDIDIYSIIRALFYSASILFIVHRRNVNCGMTHTSPMRQPFSSKNDIYASWKQWDNIHLFFDSHTNITYCSQITKMILLFQEKISTIEAETGGAIEETWREGSCCSEDWQCYWETASAETQGGNGKEDHMELLCQGGNGYMYLYM